MRLRIYKTGIAVAVVLTALMIFPGSNQLSAATPLTVVHGPLPATADSYPFGAADQTRVPTDLKKVGYVEEEYLVEGKANVYEWPAQGPAVIHTADAPFDRAQLKKLYPNHKAYVNAVAKNLSSLVSQRFVTRADANKLLEEAKRAEVP